MSNGILAEELAVALWGDGGAPADRHGRGVVASSAGDKVLVRVRGSDPMTCAKLASYAPQVGDVVLVLMMPSGGVVLGKIG